MKSKVSLSVLTHVALLVAIEIILTRFCSINTPILRIGFGFVPIAICAMMYGPVWAGIAAGVGDILGLFIFPSGAYFPGFTLSIVLTGVVFGLFLHRQTENKWPGILAAVGINCIGISLLLNTLWLSITTGSSYPHLLSIRLVQCLVLIPVQVVLLRALCRPVAMYSKRLRTS